MLRPVFVPRATAPLACAAAMLLVAAAVPAGDPATSSSLPWKVGRPDAIAVVGSTIYVANRDELVPRANTGFGLAVFPASEALAVPGPATNGNVSALVPDGAGGWYVGGSFTTIGGLPRAGLAHVLAGGSVDSAFVANVSGGGVAALVLNGGRLIVGGSFTTVNLVPRVGLAIVDAATGLVQAAAPTINGSAAALALSGSTLVVGGQFTLAGGQVRVGLASFNAGTGALVTGFVANVGAGDAVRAVAIDGTAVYVGGFVQSVNGTPRAYAAKVDLATGFVDPQWNPAADAPVTTLGVGAGSVFAGGQFTAIGGQPRGHLAALNTTTGAASTWRADTDGIVNGLRIDAGAVYAVGPFRTVGGVTRQGAAGVSTSTPAVVLPWHPSLGATALSVAVSGGNVAVGGSFEGWGVAQKRSIAAFDMRTGDLLPWAPVVTGNGISAIVAAGTRLVVTGNFSAIDGLARANLAAFDLATHTLLPLSVAIDGPIYAAASIGNVLYLGGQFTAVNGITRINLAAIDLVTGQVLPWDIQADDVVFAITALQDRVIVGGRFSSLIGGNGFQLRQGLGAITTAGDVTPFDVQLANSGGPAFAADLAVDGARLFFTGDFSAVQGTARTAAAAVDVTSAALLPWNPSPDKFAALSVHRGSVYLAGLFTTVGGQPRRGLVRVDDASGVLSPWKPLPEPISGQLVHAVDAGVVFVGDRLGGQDRLEFFPEQALGGAPGAPPRPSARIVGATLSLAWAPPVMGPRPTGYVLEAGSGPGLSNIATLPLAGTSFSVAGVPPGTYFLRVRAVGTGGVGAASGEIAVAVGSPTCTAPPLTPTVPVVTVAGASIVLGWQASSGAVPTAFTLLVGTAPGLTNIGAIGVGGATTFATGGVPAGAYFVRVLAGNACGFGVPATDALVRVGGAAGPPSVPVQLTGTSAGGVVSLAWLTTTSGGTPTSHLLEVGTAPGLSNIGVLPLGAATTLTAPGVPPGTYYLRVRAVNGAGASAASGELVLVVS